MKRLTAVALALFILPGCCCSTFTPPQKAQQPNATAQVPDEKTPTILDKGKPNPERLKTEYIRFAALASMESDTLDFHFDRSAPWRAKKLQSLGLTHPTLRKAADDFAKTAAMYAAAVILRDSSFWSEEDLREMFRGLDIRDDRDMEIYLGRGIKGTLDRVRSLEA